MTTDERLAEIEEELEWLKARALGLPADDPGWDHLYAAREDVPAVVALAHELLAEVKRLKALHEWQPIETAPKDGTRVLAFCRGEWHVMLWEDGAGWAVRSDALDGFVGIEGHDPTHWMHLPEPPGGVR